MNSWHLYGLMVMAQVTAITVVAAVIIACLQRWAAPRHSVGALALAFVLMSPVSALFLPQSGWLVRDTSPASQAAPFTPTRAETSQVGTNHYEVSRNREQVAAVGPSNKLLTRRQHSEASAAITHDSNATVSKVGTRKSHRRWRGLIHADRNTWLARSLNLAGSVWLAGVAVCGWAFIRRRQQLNRLASSLQTAPISSEVLNDVRTATDLVELPRVATSDFAPTPFVLGCWRPVVVVPQFLVEAGSTSQLREILVHECAHIRRGDPWIHMAQRVASVLFWLHPGVHWINRQIAQSREELCDNFVLAKTDAVDYAQTLLDLAERCGGTSGALPLVGFFTSQWTLERRISELLDKNRSRQIRAGLTLPVITGGALAVLAVAVGGTGVLGQIAPEAGAIAPAVAPSVLQLRAVDAGSGTPLSGVTVTYNLYTNHDRLLGVLETDEEGVALIQWKPDAVVSGLVLTARKAGFVPVHIRWDDRRREVRLPEVKELRFDRGVKLGGKVEDESGQPVPGAEILIHIPATEYETGVNYIFDLASLVTDEQGRWQVDTAPEDTEVISAFIKHPDYLEVPARLQPGLENVTVLKPGYKITGRVLDMHGRPIQHAALIWGTARFSGSKRETATGEDGSFELANCPAGHAPLTAHAAGYAPDLVQVDTTTQATPVEFRLKPGNVIRGRIVDLFGEPVAGASVLAETWRGYRTLRHRVRTDDDGHFVWNSAPEDTVQMDVLKAGYMPARKVPFRAGEDPQLVTLYPPVVIRGSVADAKTGMGISEFRVVPGYQRHELTSVSWEHRNASAQKDGRYTARFDHPYHAMFVRIEAPGYEPAESPAFDPKRGAQQWNALLQPASTDDVVAGVVLLPDGTSVPRAHVALGTRARQASIHNGRLRSDGGEPRTNTDRDGFFRFPRPSGDFLVVVAHESGFAAAPAEEFANSRIGKLTLQPWGKISGRALIGDTPAADNRVYYKPELDEDWQDVRTSCIWVQYETRTSADGSFSFDRALPGFGVAYRALTIIRPKNVRSPHLGWPIPIGVPAGETVQVQLGGTGRAVTGKIELDRRARHRIDWGPNDPVELLALDPEKGDRAELQRRYFGRVDSEGRFLIDDVPTGLYKLIARVKAWPEEDTPFPGVLIARGESEITVPMDAEEEPLDVGTVVAHVLDDFADGQP